MDFKPVQKLKVQRTLSTGEIVLVGMLAQSKQGVFFQYQADYLSEFGNLSPFSLQATTRLQAAPAEPHNGLHGVFADSLPDGWGLLLQDRVFRQVGVLPNQVTAMDRLAFVGARGMGALSFSPVSDFKVNTEDEVNLAALGLQAQATFDQAVTGEGEVDQVFSALVAAGSSGGARPKAQVYFSANNFKQCRTQSKTGDEAWLIKFTSQNLALGHEEGLCEAVYLDLAKQAGLEPPEWKLLEAPAKSGAKAWLAVKRFDWLENAASGKAGRLHLHSACGLLDADYRTPSLDYADLIKASRQLCKSPAVGQLQFKRAMFNLFACNQDDHSKNWAFLQKDKGDWQPAPFYDVTFSPHPFNEHATAFVGHGKKPPLASIQKLASIAGFANWQEAQQAMQEVVEVLDGFRVKALALGVKKNTVIAIEKALAKQREENKFYL